jgi:hypothetical protein
LLRKFGNALPQQPISCKYGGLIFLHSEISKQCWSHLFNINGGFWWSAARRTEVAAAARQANFKVIL